MTGSPRRTRTRRRRPSGPLPLVLCTLLALLPLAGGACMGSISGEAASATPASERPPGAAAPRTPGADRPGPTPVGPGAPAEALPGPAGLRLLTVAQYGNALRDLLGAAVPAPRLEGWHTSLQGAQGGLSPQLVEQVEAAALAAAASAFSTPAARTRLVGCDPAAAAGRGDACAARFLRGFLRRAWRRPPADGEVDRYAQLARGAAAALGGPWRGIELAVAGALQSPHFLFRAELGAPVPGRPGLRRFTDLELASRISFFLWNAPPDEALLDAAERGLLATPAGLTDEVRRLLGSPRARHGLLQPFEDLLDLHALPGLQKDPTAFPSFGAPLAEAMREEVRRTLEDHLFDRRADLRDLLVRRETFVDNALAKLYGLPTRTPDGFRAATWLESTPRAGLLGFSGLLALQANQLTASPTLRGKHVREAFLCLPTPPPPPGVDTTLPPVNGAERRTTRQRLVAHQENEACAGCHALMDPLGFALETFDAIGAYRATENGLPIDPSGALDGVPFADARGLGAVLREDPRLGPCLVRQVFRHAVGRMETAGEEPALAALAAAFSRGGHQIAALAEALATSEAFRLAAATEP